MLLHDCEKHVTQSVQETDKQTCVQDTIVTLEIMMCMGEDRAQRRKESTVLVMEIWKRKANKQNCQKLRRSSTLCSDQ